MPAPDSEPGRSSDGQEWFATTHWSVVLAAGHDSAPGARDALEKRCPEKIYERRWALTLLDQVLRQLEAEFAATGKRQLFEQLKVFLLEDKGVGSYAETAARLEMTEGALRVAVHRLRYSWCARPRAQQRQNARCLRNARIVAKARRGSTVGDRMRPRRSRVSKRSCAAAPEGGRTPYCILTFDFPRELDENHDLAVKMLDELGASNLPKPA